jgi:dipeptidyl aminopeptidase/acylaminoacyl peptidase
LAGAQPAASLASQTVQFSETAISPDGKHLAWVEALRNADGSESTNTSVTLDGKKLTAGNGKAACEEKGLAWSADSGRLAFLSDCGQPKQLQLYTVAVAGSGSKHDRPRKLTSLTGYLANPRWSPDGTMIALLFTANAKRVAGPLEPSLKDEGVVEEQFFEQRLTLVNADSGAARPITPADTYVYEFDWSPDGASLAYTAAKGNGDNNWWVAELFTVRASDGTVQRVAKPAAQIAVPRFTRDGRQIVFIGGLMSDEGSTGGDIYAVSAGGGDPRDLTPGRKASPSSLQPLANGKILFTETVDGSTAIGLLNPGSGETETLWKGDESLRSGDDVLSVAADGRTVATVQSSWLAAPEVWAGPLGEWSARTNANKALHPRWGAAEKIHWMSGGTQVEGWLLAPAVPNANAGAGKKFPLVVSIHGGPAAASKPHWPGWFDMAWLSAEGYYVLFPNPRGSYGAGEAFTHNNVRDFGYGDLQDINSGVDQVIASYPVDAQRVGIAGWSYGGYMTMWAVTQTTRFKAAVAGAGIADWQSYYGENLIDQWMIPYFGASVYDDPAVYAKSSPITFIKNVKTPTLVVVGDSDAECPSPQSYEFWHALKTLGVKTQLVIYPNEGHRFHVPEHQRDVVQRTIDWFKQNL